MQAESTGQGLVSDCDIIVADMTWATTPPVSNASTSYASNVAGRCLMILTGHDVEKIQAAFMTVRSLSCQTGTPCGTARHSA